LSKDGIKKLVLRNVIPLINSNLNNLLSGVDFNVELEIDDKNNLAFLLYKENDKGEFEYGELKTASGYERTMSSLAIRSILYKMGATPMLSLCVLDEIIATVSETNFDNLYNLLEQISGDYDTLFVISHSSQFNQYFEKVITIVKENNISKIVKQ
jgi:DNA repair exonuclease SbcCD ATPase subunit